MKAEAFTRKHQFTGAAAHKFFLAVQAVIYFCGLKGMMPGRLNHTRFAEFGRHQST